MRSTARMKGLEGPSMRVGGIFIVMLLSVWGLIGSFMGGLRGMGRRGREGGVVLLLFRGRGDFEMR